MQNIKPYEGIYLVEPLEDQQAFSIDPQQNRRVLKGKVIKVGPALQTGEAKEIKPTLSPGNIIYFLSYDDNYDNCTINGQKIYFIKFQDVRGFEA